MTVVCRRACHAYANGADAAGISSSTSQSGDRGTASVEHAGLAALIALIVVGALSALASAPPPQAGRDLAASIGRRIACAPRHPVPCNRNPLALTYGFPIGKLVRSLAPTPAAGFGGGGLVVPVDFRRCRLPSCAAPGPDRGLSTANRRVTAFTWVDDQRASGGGVGIEYWLYRPGLGWETIRVRAGDAEIAAAASLRLRLSDDPALVPLETLPGRNHYDFADSEEPGWLWRP